MDLSQVSDEQLMQAAGIGAKSSPDLSSISDEDLAKAAGVPLKNPRTNEAAQAMLDNFTGQQPSALLTGIKVLGAGAGAVNDKLMNAIPDSIKSGLTNMQQQNADAIDSTSAGQWLGDKLLAAKDAVSGLAQQNPETAKVINALGNIAPVAGMAEGATNVTNGIGNMGQDIAAQRASYVPKPLNTDMLNSAASNAYGVVNNADTGFTPNFGIKGSNIIEQAKETPISGMQLTSEQAGVNKMLDEYKGLGSQPLTLSDYQKLDSTLGNKAAQAYIAGDSNTSRIIGGVQDKIRDMVKPSTLDPADITGSPEGVNTLTQDAIPMWSVKRKIEDLQAIVDNANMTKNPQTAMMTGFKNYIKSGRSAALPPEVQQLVQQMATQGTGADLLSIVGSRLNPIAAGAVGGPASAIVAQGGSLLARTVQNRLVNNRADAIINSMLEQVRPSIEKFHNYTPPIPEAAPPLLQLPDYTAQRLNPVGQRPLQLPAPPSDFIPSNQPYTQPTGVADRPYSGQMRPQTAAERDAAISMRQNPDAQAAQAARADQTPSSVLNTELRQQMTLKDSQTAWDKAFGNLAQKFTYKEIINKIGERPKS